MNEQTAIEMPNLRRYVDTILVAINDEGLEVDGFSANMEVAPGIRVNMSDRNALMELADGQTKLTPEQVESVERFFDCGFRCIVICKKVILLYQNAEK